MKQQESFSRKTIAFPLKVLNIGFQGNMGAASAYARVPMAAAQALATQGAADLAVYLPNPAGDAPLLYREAGLGLRRPDIPRLSDHGVSCLLVRGEDIDRCETMFEAKLGEVLSNPDIDSAKKANFVHHVGTSIAQDLIREPGDSAGLQRASGLLDNVISWALTDSEASSQLLAMAGHHRTTASHMFVVSALGVILAEKAYGCDHEILKEVGLAGLLHDLGKMGIDSSLLNKTTPLTAEERQHIQQHPIESVRLINDNPQATTSVRQMILQHHERTDGRGYPLGIAGGELLPGSKILLIVDSFHAMIGRRSYRDRLSPAEANEALVVQSGRQFDPELVACWEELFSRHWREDLFVQAMNLKPAEGEPPSHHEHSPRQPRKEAQPRGPRLACNRRVRVFCLYAGRLKSASPAPDEFIAPLHDVSRGGMCVCTDYPMYRGEVVHVRIRVDDKTVWVAGIVAWCRRGADNQSYRTGVRFTHRISPAEAGEKTPAKGMDDPYVCPPVGPVLGSTPEDAGCPDTIAAAHS